MKPHRTRFLSIPAVATVAAMALAACSSSGSGSSTSSTGSGNTGSGPITIGASLSTTGDFSADGQAFQRGYQLWASEVNSQGGLLGHHVNLTFLNDQSDATTEATNYTKLIAQEKVNFVFGPFSTLLTVPAVKVAARYGDASLRARAAARPTTSSACRTCSTEPAHRRSAGPFANWVASLPASQRPKTAAYPMADHPFADPMTMTAQAILQRPGSDGLRRSSRRRTRTTRRARTRSPRPGPSWSSWARWTCPRSPRSSRPSSSSTTTRRSSPRPAGRTRGSRS